MISETIPEGFKTNLEVVSCYLEHAGKILLLQRHPHHKHSSKWGLPAGKREQGESIKAAIVREIKEETGLVVTGSDLTYREVLFVAHAGKEFLYHVFHAQLQRKPDVRINPPEHSQFGWFTPEQALKLDFIHDLDACIQRHYEGVVVAEAAKF